MPIMHIVYATSEENVYICEEMQMKAIEHAVKLYINELKASN